MENFSRIKMLLGQDKLEKLLNKKIIIFGIGGVGSYVFESLVRSGIGNIDIVDSDVVSESNINRQLVANYNTIGKYKTEVAKLHGKEISPECIINAYNLFIDKSTIEQIDFSKYDYVIDCVDNVTAKLLIIEKAKQNNCEVITALGCGNKLDATKLVLTDIAKTKECALARVMRYELRKRNIKKVMCIYSTEPAITPVHIEINNNKQTPASLVFVPSCAGILIANYVFRKLIGLDNDEK